MDKILLVGYCGSDKPEPYGLLTWDGRKIPEPREGSDAPVCDPLKGGSGVSVPVVKVEELVERIEALERVVYNRK